MRTHKDENEEDKEQENTNRQSRRCDRQVSATRNHAYPVVAVTEKAREPPRVHSRRKGGGRRVRGPTLGGVRNNLF